MATTFRKTAKGAAEIETRAHRLTPRLRHLLILVDGKRSSTDLQALVQQADEALAMLAEQGFIEVIAVADTARAPRGPAPPAPPPAPAIDVTTLRREMVRALTDLVGPAGETMALRIERAKTVDELRALIEPAGQLVATMRTRDLAAAFAARFTERLAAPPAPATA